MIRPYTSADQPAILEILRLNTPTYFSPLEEADLIKYLEAEKEDYFVLEVDHKIVGSGGINYFPLERTARISWDLFHPDYQGMGCGRQLTHFRIDRIKADSAIDRIIVRTSQLAYAFYHKMGFNILKIEKNFWAAGYDLYLMDMNCQVK